MTDSTDTPPTRQALAVEGRSRRMQVTGRLRAALTAMVWQGARRAEAAKISGMTDHSLRAALRKPHVKAWYLAELGVLRESERPKTFHRLTELRDQDENKNAAVAAAKALEQISDEQMMRPNAAAATPGVVLRLITITQSPVDTKVIDVRPREPELEPLPVQPFDPIFACPKIGDHGVFPAKQ